LSLLLHIDTATEVASVALSNNDTMIALLENHEQKEHASFVHVAIESLLKQSGHSVQELAAVSVTHGPGSYTGLRVGMSAAKGICYALNIPMVTVNTLKVMTVAAMEQVPDHQGWYVPMIDARRMEVFTAIYDAQLNEVMEPQSMVLEGTSFYKYMTKIILLYFGSGSDKFMTIEQHENARFANVQHTASQLVTLGWQGFQAKDFCDTAYAEPLYLKEFFTTAKRV